MASYTIQVSSKSKYRSDLNAMWLEITDAGWPRRTKVAEHVYHEIQVSDGSKSVTLILRQRDLYIVGIKQTGGKVFFKDEADPSAKGLVTKLSITSSYTKPTSDGLGVLKDEKLSKTFKWGKQEVSQAIADIGSFNPKNALTDEFRKGMGIFAFLIAEAMRFNEMFSLMQRLLASQSVQITFGDYAHVVKNWSKTSKTTGQEDSAKHETLKRLKTKLI